MTSTGASPAPTSATRARSARSRRPASEQRATRPSPAVAPRPNGSWCGTAPADPESRGYGRGPRGCSSMAESQPSKLVMPVRSRSPAPRRTGDVECPARRSALTLGRGDQEPRPGPFGTLAGHLEWSLFAERGWVLPRRGTAPIESPSEEIVSAVTPFSADPSSVTGARHFVAHSLTADGCPYATVETAKLLVSEIASNAVLHARSPFQVSLSQHDHSLTIAVTDDCATEPS